jgi:hypothetical protein
VPVAQDLAANAQHHWRVPRYQSGESHLRTGIALGREPLEELAITQPGDGAAVEERLDLPGDRTGCWWRQVRGFPMRPRLSLVRF